MTLIKSISGIRGTIGGKVGDGLTPLDTVKFTAAYGTWLKLGSSKTKLKVVVGRDARLSGQMVENLVVGTLQGLGINVVNLGFSTTPTVEVAVPLEGADGGIILTASHNPKQWNALKLLNGLGEFISAEDGAELLAIAENESFSFAEVDDLGNTTINNTYIQKHIDAVLKDKYVDVAKVKEAKFKVVVDCVNSTGGISMVPLLHQMGVEVVELYCEPTGHFPHNPEPLPENLTEIAKQVKDHKADLGIVVDPDVDRLCFVCETGEMFGEEYTLVAVADFLLKKAGGGNTVSNLSSTRALRDVTEKYGGTYAAGAVGEVNVVNKMKETNALIGGEGNGGVIYPGLHYGRDALMGTALFLTHLAEYAGKVSALRASYPQYVISKNKIELTPEIDVDKILVEMEKKYAHENVNTIDGVKIDFANEWVHLRKSNTEPIIRIYSESKSASAADALANKIIADIKSLI